MGKPAVDLPTVKVRESSILDAFKREWETVTGKFTGGVLHAYNFQYNANVKSPWYDGTIVPITTGKEQIGKESGINVSFWLFEPTEEKRLRELVNLLLPISDNGLLHPLYVAYNSQIDKTVVCCTPCDTSFSDWISQEVRVPADGYISDDAKNMIRSMLLLSEVLWDKGFVCDGLNDPFKYVMKDSKVKFLPFHICEKKESDTERTHRIQLANLLEHHLNARWIDPDATAFIAVLRNPAASLIFLLRHPLLLEPEERMSVYLLFNKNTNLSAAMVSEYARMGFNNWIASIPVNDVVLQKILTFKKNDEHNKVCMYTDTSVEAHRYCRNTCSHYLSHWRKLIKSFMRRKAQADMVDKNLKRCFPGLVSMVYALTLCVDWTARN